MRACPGSVWGTAHGLFLAASLADAAYTLRQSYDAQSQSFFTGFNFRDSAYFASLGLSGGRTEPSGGYVNYVGYEEAMNLGLAAYINDQVFLGADSLSVVNTGTGRNSVRLESKRAFDEGLLIADIARMPGNACGMWPAFWTFNFDEQPYGEIDIIEGSAHQTENRVSLHTCSECAFNMTSSIHDEYQKFYSMPRSNCDLQGDDGCENPKNPQGCGLFTRRGTYGTDFNANGGGVWATQLSSDGVRVWFFARENITSDILAGAPDPALWGVPEVEFRSSTRCSVSNHWRKQTIVININFCGDSNDAQVWRGDMQCHSNEFPTCESYVGGNPDAYKEAYWLFNYIKVYRKTQ